jgi:hypothetical protein
LIEVYAVKSERARAADELKSITSSLIRCL